MTALSGTRSAFALPALPRGVRLQVLRARMESGHLITTASTVALLGLLNMTLGLTDMMMVGRFDPQGLAAILIMGDLYSIVFNFTAGFAGLVAPHVANAIGARLPWQVCTIVQRVVVLVSALAVFGMVLIWNAASILEAVGIRLDQPQITRDYAHYMAGAYAFMVLFAFSRHALSAVARSNFAIGAIVLALPLNVLANHVFMGGAFGWPGMGVAGAGLASLVVAIGMGGAVTAFLFLSPSFDRYRAPVMPPVFVLPELAALVRPAALMGLAAIAETGPFLGATVLVGIVAADDLIAHGLAFRAMAVCYLLLAGLGQAVTLRIACLRGRSALRREAHALQMTAALGLVLIAGILTLFVFNPDAIALAAAGALGSVDAAPVAGTADLLPLTGLALAAAVPAHLISAVLRARGEALAALVVFAIGHGGVGLLSMSFLGTAGFGAAGIWSGLALGATVGSAWGVWHLRPRSALADGVSAGRRVMLMSGKGAS